MGLLGISVQLKFSPPIRVNQIMNLPIILNYHTTVLIKIRQ